MFKGYRKEYKKRFDWIRAGKLGADKRNMGSLYPYGLAKRKCLTMSIEHSTETIQTHVISKRVR